MIIIDDIASNGLEFENKHDELERINCVFLGINQLVMRKNAHKLRVCVHRIHIICGPCVCVCVGWCSQSYKFGIYICYAFHGSDSCKKFRVNKFTRPLFVCLF